MKQIILIVLLFASCSSSAQQVNLDVNAFEKATGEFPCEKIGVVTTGEIVVDGDFWGTIDWWKEKYESAIGNYLSKEEAGAALSSI